MRRYRGIRFSDVDLQKVRQVVTQSKAVANKMYELVKVAENEQQKNPNDFWIKSSTQDFKKAERFAKQLEKTILQIERNYSSGKPFKELFKKSVGLLHEIGDKIAGAVHTDEYPTVNKLRSEVRQLQKSAFMTGMDVELKTRNIEFDNQTRYRGIRFGKTVGLEEWYRGLGRDANYHINELRKIPATSKIADLIDICNHKINELMMLEKQYIRAMKNDEIAISDIAKVNSEIREIDAHSKIYVALARTLEQALKGLKSNY